MEYWNKQLFNYCERALDGAFWAEPLNAVSNAAFWLAAALALALWLRLPRHERAAVDLVLVVLVLAIGTGSFLPATLTETYATADIISYDGEARVKMGREFLFE